FYTDSVNMESNTHIKSHMIFWFAYSATWAMLHSIFAAKISKGRTIKEMILTYFLAPTMLAWVATGILGGLGVERQLTNKVDVLGLVQGSEPVQAIPDILSSLPFSAIAMVVFIIVSMIFLTTTLDSTTYTISAYTSNRD